MKRLYATEMPTGTKAFLASSQFSVKGLGGVQQCWTSLSQTLHNRETFFSCHVHCVISVNCFFLISLFKRGQLKLTKTLRTFTNGKQSGLSGQITLMSETQ